MVDGARLANGKFFPIKQTKGDKIRQMSDKELAEYHVEKCGCPPGHDSIFCGIATTGCVGCWLKWLKQEVDEE